MGEPVTAEQMHFVRCIARERIRHPQRFVAARLVLFQQRRQILSGMGATRIVQTAGPRAPLTIRSGSPTLKPD
jgi:hypothetical protein